jgi:hypothetical protein
VVDPGGAGALGSFCASVRFDEAGRIDRYLEYSCPEEIRPTPAASVRDGVWSPAGDDAFEALDRYFIALDESRFRDAADVFSVDALYSHPPYTDQPDLPGTRRVDFVGCDALYQDSFSKRSPHALIHRVLDGVQRGPHCIVEGIVQGLPDGATVSFLSSLTMDSDATIRRYASWCSRPGVSR